LVYLLLAKNKKFGGLKMDVLTSIGYEEAKYLCDKVSDLDLPHYDSFGVSVLNLRGDIVYELGKSAQNKARTALAFQCSTGVLSERLDEKFGMSHYDFCNDDWAQQAFKLLPELSFHRGGLLIPALEEVEKFSLVNIKNSSSVPELWDSNYHNFGVSIQYYKTSGCHLGAIGIHSGNDSDEEKLIEALWFWYRSLLNV
jgi:hypothetical protein